MSASELAESLNKTKLYSKGDGSEIKSSQINARVKNYPHLFSKSGTNISLKSIIGIVDLVSKDSKELISKKNVSPELLVKMLMNPKNFKDVSKVENQIPDIPGIYCIKIKNPKLLDQPFADTLEQRKHNILYIGIASKSLRKRLLGQELRAKGHGTFFRSLGAVLKFKPQAGSLIGKKNQNNFKFCKPDETKVVNWINENLLINFVSTHESLRDLENQLILKYKPLLNLAGNPFAMAELTALRKECKLIARGSISEKSSR